MKRIIYLAAVMVASLSALGSDAGKINITNLTTSTSDGNFNVAATVVLDSLHLSPNRQILISPVIEDNSGNGILLPSLLVNGRNMHIAWQRGTISKKFLNGNTPAQELQRYNGKSQNVQYQASLPIEPWMLSSTCALRFVSDDCGCGVASGSQIEDQTLLDLNPFKKMKAAYITPAVTELPVAIHEGRARVQFEVDRTELHTEPYKCKNGQRIDNRRQLGVIRDSVDYAISNPDVEIASIHITGLASPESPYVHNEFLATARSRALAEYLANYYKLDADKVHYDAVAENWAEFRNIVAEAKDISESQRGDLLELIDRPVYGPADYDAKEKELKSSGKFAELYKGKILPEWFPQLRATRFEIKTRLRPVSDERLAQIIKQTPQLMSLNQMMRVARLYSEGSPEFNEAIETALQYYPQSKEAALNVAVAAIGAGNIERAEALLPDIGNSAEAWNLRGIVATKNLDFDKAKEYFSQAGDLPGAKINLNVLKELIDKEI